MLSVPEYAATEIKAWPKSLASASSSAEGLLATSETRASYTPRLPPCPSLPLSLSELDVECEMKEACRRSSVMGMEREGGREKGEDALVVDSHFLAASAGSLCSVSGFSFSIRTLLLFHFVSFRFNFIMSQKWTSTRRTRGRVVHKQIQQL